MLCSCGARSRPPSPPALFSETVIDTTPGLSDLTADANGALWTISERARRAFRLVPDGGSFRITPYDVVGVPDGTDIEALALLSPGHFVLGGEGRREPGAFALFGELIDDRLVVTQVVDLPDAALGLHLSPNAGAEGICSAGGTVLVGIESNTRDRDGRWSPVIELEHGAIVKTHKLRLRTSAGKLSALSCRRTAGGIEALAIERNFNETKILTFAIGADTTDITPRELFDLGPVLRNRLNLEGIVWLPDGSIAAVNDNDFRGVTGPSEIIRFPAALVRAHASKR